MRIAICITDLGGGGAERVCLWVAKGLIERGHEVDFLLLEPKIHYPHEVPSSARIFVLDTTSDDRTRTMSRAHLERCIPLETEARTTSRLRDYVRLIGALRWSAPCWWKTYRHPVDALRRNPLAFPNGHWLRLTRFVASYVSKEEPDCILSSSHLCTIATLWATVLLPKFPPIIPIFHSSLRWKLDRKNKIRYSRLLDRSAHIVSVSHGVRNEVLKLMDVPSDEVSTIYNPAITPDMDKLRKEAPDHPWMVDDGPPVVLATGRLHEEKDYPTLLKAFRHLTRTRKLRLIILGEGKRRQELEDCVRSLDLEDKVSLPGWTDNPFAFMSRAALFVLSSEHEGLSNVLIEALACGCPVVSTDCPSGPSEILEGGRFGPLVPVGDHVALADAMGRVLDDPPDKEMLMRRAAFFSADKAVDAYERLIVETVRRHRAASDAGTIT